MKKYSKFNWYSRDKRVKAHKSERVHDYNKKRWIQFDKKNNKIKIYCELQLKIKGLSVFNGIQKQLQRARGSVKKSLKSSEKVRTMNFAFREISPLAKFLVYSIYVHFVYIFYSLLLFVKKIKLCSERFVIQSDQ